MIVLAAVNAKYIHSNLAVYTLQAYAQKQLEAGRPDNDFCMSEPKPEIRIAEYTINQPKEEILASLYEMQADVVAFSCYIWNVEYICQIASQLKKIAPRLRLWIGGPEVSYHPEMFLQEHPYFELIFLGEGEQAFAQAIQRTSWEEITGIAYRKGNQIQVRPSDVLVNLDDIPFIYQDMKPFDHRIVYYESSRGCPFRCSYCLSSIDKQVRFRSMKLVKQELQFFLNAGLPQVKFIDRTFNCNADRALEIWEYLAEHDNGVTNFHFEISADLITKEQIACMAGMRKGLIQLEIGLQTTNPDTVAAIERTMNIGRLRTNMLQIHQGNNVHQHLDLIAGLPFENLEQFHKSFDDAYAMQPEQLQLGFLKVLKGSKMEEQAEEFGLTYMDVPPYEVLATKWMTYAQLRLLKRVEDMLEVYHNSGQFRYSLEYLLRFQKSPFDFFRELGDYYKKNGLDALQWKRLERYNILRDFAIEKLKGESDWSEAYMNECLLHDLYLRENLKKRPLWAPDYGEQKKEFAGFFRNAGYTGKQVHLEPYEKEGIRYYRLYDYERKNRWDSSADVSVISEEEFRRILAGNRGMEQTYDKTGAGTTNCGIAE